MSNDARALGPDLAVIGMGYVGLPLAMSAARSGLRVAGFDIDAARVRSLNRGESHIRDVRSKVVREAVDGGRFSATTEVRELRGSRAFAICVPTPLSKVGDPEISHVLAASRTVAEALAASPSGGPPVLVALESTTYPGTTREVVLPVLEGSGRTLGEDFHLCFSPERVDPANAVWGTRNTPKVIGGITPSCTEAGQSFYSRFVREIVPVSTAEVAEMSKILENAFRAVNIALANEMALIADRLNLNIWEVIEAAGTKPFGFMKFVPGPGLGGHCIPVDPHFLSWKMKTLDYRTRLIDLAASINAEMPPFVASKVRQALNEAAKPVRGAEVLLLGVAYKRDVEDVRESPASDIFALLERDGARVRYHDPMVPAWNRGEETLYSEPLSGALLSSVDVVVIVTDHSGIDYGEVYRRARLLVDARNAAAGHADAKAASPAGWILKRWDTRQGEK